MPELVSLDRDNWRTFMQVQWATHQAGHCSPPVQILARAYVHRAMDAQAWGIVEGDQPVGIVMWWTWQGGPAERWLVVDQLLIDASWQRRGLARWAIDQARAVARRRGLAGLMCCVVEGNAESESLMAACGFERAPAYDDGHELGYVLPL